MGGDWGGDVVLLATAAMSKRADRMTELWRRICAVYNAATPGRGGTPDQHAVWHKRIAAKGNEYAEKTPRGGRRFNLQHDMVAVAVALVGAVVLAALNAVSSQGKLPPADIEAVRHVAFDVGKLVEDFAACGCGHNGQLGPLMPFERGHAVGVAFGKNLLRYDGDYVAHRWTLANSNTPGPMGWEGNAALTIVSSKKCRGACNLRVVIFLATMVPQLYAYGNPVPTPPLAAACMTDGAITNLSELGALLGSLAASRPCGCVPCNDPVYGPILELCERGGKLLPGTRRYKYGGGINVCAAAECHVLIDLMALADGDSCAQSCQAPKVDKLQQEVEATRAEGGMYRPRMENEAEDLYEILRNPAVQAGLARKPLLALQMKDTLRYLGIKCKTMVRYHPGFMHAMLVLYNTSRISYERMRNTGYLLMPSDRQMRRINAAAGAQSGWDDAVFEHMYESHLDHACGPYMVVCTVCDGAAKNRAFQRMVHDEPLAEQLMRELRLEDLHTGRGRAVCDRVREAAAYVELLV
ncbi:hypothetical protein FOA52_009171 [Chlamydomonas sp. UWO 241]|nr:hypothetical protein FOA52_009171 [Chlamydomonas sp. UWO 241]